MNLTKEQLIEWVTERSYNSGRAYFYVKEFIDFLTANTAEDEKVCPICRGEGGYYFPETDEWRKCPNGCPEPNTAEDENQIAIGKIEEYKREFPNSYDCHEVADDIINWLQSEDK